MPTRRRLVAAWRWPGPALAVRWLHDDSNLVGVCLPDCGRIYLDMAPRQWHVTQGGGKGSFVPMLGVWSMAARRRPLAVRDGLFVWLCSSLWWLGRSCWLICGELMCVLPESFYGCKPWSGRHRSLMGGCLVLARSGPRQGAMVGRHRGGACRCGANFRSPVARTRVPVVDEVRSCTFTFSPIW